MKFHATTETGKRFTLEYQLDDGGEQFSLMDWSWDYRNDIEIVLTRISPKKWVARYHGDNRGYVGTTLTRALYALNNGFLQWRYMESEEDARKIGINEFLNGGLDDDFKMYTSDGTEIDPPVLGPIEAIEIMVDRG